MDYNHTTRNQLYQSFIDSHQPGKLFSVINGAESKGVFKVFTSLSTRWNDEDKNIYNKICHLSNHSSDSPGKFMKSKYDKVIEFCVGSKKEAEILYSYFDKLNEFPYTQGWARRTLRTKAYINPVNKIQRIIYVAYNLQMFGGSLSDYLLGNMNEELLDYKRDRFRDPVGLDDIIAAHIDVGDNTVKNALKQIINAENNAAFVTVQIIRGIIKGNDTELHKLLCQLLMAARLQEGLRQAICENTDCGTMGAFRMIFDTIDKNDLLRFSAVRRAVATWIGVLDPESLVRSSDKTFKLMKEVVFDKNAAYGLINTTDAVSILVGLWGLGIYESNDAVSEMEKIIDIGNIQQKRVASFYNQVLQNRAVQQKFANKLMECVETDIELASGIFPTYMSDYQSEVIRAFGNKNDKERNIRAVDLSLWFDSREKAFEHVKILKNLLSQMKQKKYQFNPYIFPWNYTEISYSDVLIRLCAIANGLCDDDLMDELSESLSFLDATNNSRVLGARLLLAKPNTPKRREALISALADKESYTRREAYEIAKNIKFTQEEYAKMCELLRFKASDMRLNLISLIKMQSDEGLINSLEMLIKSDKEEVRLAGLDILKSISEDVKMTGLVEKGKSLIAEISKPTQRETIIIEEIFGNKFDAEKDTAEEEILYTDKDIIPLPEMEIAGDNYPIFKITKERLAELFDKLDKVIDEHREYQYKPAYGDSVVLGNLNYLPPLKYAGTVRDRVPLYDVWEKYYKDNITSIHELNAMILALSPYKIIAGYGSSAVSDKNYDEYISGLVTDIFGEAIVKFDPSSYKYGNGASRGISVTKAGGDLFKDILRSLAESHYDTVYMHSLGKAVSAYLYKNVPENKKYITLDVSTGWSNRQVVVTPLNSALVFASLTDFANRWDNAEQFKDRFNHLYVLADKFMKIIPDSNRWEYRLRDGLVLKALDYVIAAYYEIITEEQMYKIIFDSENLRNNLQNLFIVYRSDKYAWLKKTLVQYGLDSDDKLCEYVKNVAHKVADTIVKVECRRGDSLTPYSKAVTAIEFYYGISHLVSLINALGKDKLVRSDHLGYNSNGDRRVNLSHLISVCNPLPTDTVEDFANALKGTSVTEKRLIEIAMYAPQWIDLIEEYLRFTGLKSGAYYFMAHMNDQYNRDERKFAAIARFTPLDKEELFNGAFDIQWFEEAYRVLGEKKFNMLYDAAKYISDGSKHSRARKYADAVLGRVNAEDLEKEISDKRNKDLLMSYALIPLCDEADMLRRYEFIQKFRKESSQFGAQRKASENTACDMAMKNLATRAGFKDVTRLTLVMESALAESLSHYFEWYALDSEKDIIKARIQITDEGFPDAVIQKNDKMLASIPSAYKKNEYVVGLKEASKKFKEQYKRTVKMFELAMEERELYTVSEIAKLLSNPVIKPIIDNLVFICDAKDICGIVYGNAPHCIVDKDGEIISIDGNELIRVAHPYDLYKLSIWSDWQKTFFEKQKNDGSKQPFRQVFRELYVKLDEELTQEYSRMFAGYQIQPPKTVAVLKSRRWIADYEAGLGKVFYKDNIAVNMYALADWFAPSDIEPPTLEYVTFADRKTYERICIKDVPDIVYSEAMRDVDLAVSVAHAGSVDPQSSHSTIEMRKVIAECNMELFGLNNVKIEGNHAFIKGHHGDYTVHLGSGVVHMTGVHQINVLPVHSQHRGRIFLPFIDEDPKTAEIISKIIFFAEDKKIKDPYILDQLK